MASLREAVKDFQDELRGGMAWVIFWREGRSWQSDYLYLELGNDTIPYDDMGKVQQICRLDPNAVALNGYYCGHLAEDMRLAELPPGCVGIMKTALIHLPDLLSSTTGQSHRKKLKRRGR